MAGAAHGMLRAVHTGRRSRREPAPPDTDTGPCSRENKEGHGYRESGNRSEGMQETQTPQTRGDSALQFSRAKIFYFSK